MLDPVETWLPEPSYPGLLASSSGRIIYPARTYAMPRGGSRTTKPKPTFGQVRRAAKEASCVYRAVTSRQFGNIKVHRAVCERFHGTAPSAQHVVLHLNEDGLDNRPTNLRWGTRKENQNAPGFVAWAGQVARDKFAGTSGMRKSAIMATARKAVIGDNNPPEPSPSRWRARRWRTSKPKRPLGSTALTS